MARFDGGWIKAWRKVAGSELVDNVYAWGLWHWLLYAAVYKPTKIMTGGKQRELKAGQLVFGLRELAARWGCSRETLRRWVLYLRDTGRISVDVVAQGYIVTIENWDVYQSSDVSSVADTGHARGTHLAQTGREPTLSEEEKKGRKKEEDSEGSPFEGIYKKYPRRKGDQGKKAAMKKLARDLRDPARLADFERAVSNYAAHCAAEKAIGTQYVKKFQTFVNSDWTEWLRPQVSEPTQLKTMADLEREEASHG